MLELPPKDKECYNPLHEWKGKKIQWSLGRSCSHGSVPEKSKQRKKNVESQEVKVVELEESNEELLSHVTLDGEDYFYEDKVNGNVYDSQSNKVGILKCGNINIFN